MRTGGEPSARPPDGHRRQSAAVRSPARTVWTGHAPRGPVPPEA